MEAEEAAQDWFHRDAEGSTPGMGTDRAYRTLLAGQKPKDTVIVAIIDSGVDIAHEDLQPVIWTNEDEIPDNGVDDDANGYVDDVHGWNFIGGPDGENVEYDTYEVTRLYRSLSDRFADVDSASVAPAEQADYARYQRIRSDFESGRAEAQQRVQNIRQAYQAVEASSATLKNYLQTDTLSQETVAAVNSPRTDVQRARDILMYFYQQGVSPADLTEYYEYLQTQVEYHYNPDFNPRPIVGDDYSDKTERVYGNNNVTGPDADHGTHVAGIVGAARDNGIGMDGVATGVRIMSVRAVPNGDERDKDVANAIRYAADNGADIINMSFGKAYSPYKEVVDRAVQYADSLGVLMVHAAGNDGANIDSTDSFPTRRYAEGGTASLWVEVGASGPNLGEALAASFSNYGAETVDVFAPGASIYSTVPGNGYERNGGTSMAAPMVSGLAALIMAYHPELTAAQVRSVILETGTPHGNATVTVPGGMRTAPFASLSRTGAIINAYAALQRAAAMSH
jgi:subtilisin family serine protease